MFVAIYRTFYINFVNKTLDTGINVGESISNIHSLEIIALVSNCSRALMKITRMMIITRSGARGNRLTLLSLRKSLEKKLRVGFIQMLRSRN